MVMIFRFFYVTNINCTEQIQLPLFHHPYPEIIFPLMSFVAFMFLLLIFQTTFSEMSCCDENNMTRQLRCKVVVTRSCHQQIKLKRDTSKYINQKNNPKLKNGYSGYYLASN